jgi:hypothetical protein
MNYYLEEGNNLNLSISSLKNILAILRFLTVTSFKFEAVTKMSRKDYCFLKDLIFCWYVSYVNSLAIATITIDNLTSIINAS